MSNEYGRAYATLRKSKKPHKVNKEDLKGFAPEFPVASSHPKSLVGVVELWSEWDKDRLVEWVDRSRIRYEVRLNVSDQEKKMVFKSYDIDHAIEFYNNYNS